MRRVARDNQDENAEEAGSALMEGSWPPLTEGGRSPTGVRGGRAARELTALVIVADPAWVRCSWSTKRRSAGCRADT